MQKSSSDHELGRYTGKLLLEPLSDGRRMRTALDFGFLEADGLHWPVPRGSTVDGASIPKALWTLLDGPWEGKYRDASVVHDYYCAVRSADWQSVHLMFYRAMLVSGVSARRAKVMYLAVYFAGPRWDDMVVDNVRLGPPAVPSRTEDDDNRMLFSIQHDPNMLAMSKIIGREGMSAYEWVANGRLFGNKNAEITIQLDKLEEIVEQKDLPLRTLVEAVEAAARFIPESKDSPRGIAIGNLAADES